MKIMDQYTSTGSAVHVSDDGALRVKIVDNDCSAVRVSVPQPIQQLADPYEVRPQKKRYRRYRRYIHND